MFEDAIHKFNLIDASQFKDNKEYNEAVIKLASSIKIKTPFNYSNKSLTSINNLKNNGYEIKYSTIHFEYNDIEKWKSVLRYVDQNANDDIKKNLQIYYKRFQKILEQERVYQLEDLSTKIDNLIRDYDRKTEDHVLYLKEQSSIARKLGIAKNTIEVQTFGNQNALLSNVIADSPFYFRGFEAIDEEIFLITSRKNKKAFIEGLFDLERQKREILQDKTLNRGEDIIKQTPLANDKDFIAASANVSATKFKYKNNNYSLLLALVIGLIIGTIYVIISNAVQTFKVTKKK